MDPYTGDVVQAVDRYTDIPQAVRATLKKRMAARQYDEIASIRRDSIEGRHQYAELRGMHFGAGRVCTTVTRAAWRDNHVERGMVYCESGHCLIVPTVCRNVSRVTRLPDAATVAGASAARGPTAVGEANNAGGGTGSGSGIGGGSGSGSGGGAGGMTMASANTWADAASDVGAGDPAMAASSLFPGTGFIQPVSGTPALAGGGGGGLGGVTTGAFNSAPALGGLASGSTGSGVAGASTVAALPAAASLVDSGRAAAQETATRLGTEAGLLTKPLPLPLPLAIDALPAVPEPATAVLWLAGLAAMVGLARLRRVA